jgi:hypothetical protein
MEETRKGRKQRKRKIEQRSKRRRTEWKTSAEEKGRMTRRREVKERKARNT